MMESTTILNQALQRLNQIGAAISQLDTDGLTSAETVLCMIVDSATDLVPGSSAIVYTYDEEQQAFDSSSRVSEEHDIRLEAEPGAVVLDDTPRPHGLGYRAVRRRGRVLSYEEADVDINPAKRAMGARVMVCYPLILSNEVLGVLYIYLHEDRHFTELELLMLENFVNLTAMTLLLGRRQMQVQQEQVRKDRELRRLRRAGILISSRSSLKATLETILQVALDITDAIYGIFRLVDSSGENLVTQAISGSGLEKPAVETLPINENSVMGLAALRRESIVIPDLWEEPWNNIYYPFDHRLEMRSELTVPLIGGSGRLEGVLNLESPLVNAFDRQDRYILQILATQAVVAIQEAHLLDTLQDISALLIRHSPELIYQSLVDHACDLLNVSRAMIWLKDKDTLLLQASNETSLPGLRIPAGETLTGEVIQTGRPAAVLIGEGEQPRDYPDLPGFDGKGAALIVPILSSGTRPGADRFAPAEWTSTPIGAFSIFTGPDEQRDFDQSDWDKKVLSILGHYAALAVQSLAQQEALRLAQEQRATTEAFAAIGDIAANLLHRLNNKIGTIPVRVEGIQDKSSAALKEDGYLEKNLAEIERSAVEAMEVVRESLYHLHPIQLSPVSVAGSVREAQASARLPQGVTLEIENLDHLPPVQAGPKRLGLVFSNLFENAVDAMSSEGVIRVSGRTENGRVEVRVSDTGPGIEPDLHERVFEFNYSARASAHPGKLGFGLWWVKSLMARFGGTVTVESDGQNGTTFILTLPQAVEDEWQIA